MPGPLYPIQPTFARGEISPRLFSRADIDHWKMSLAECLNWIILKQGGLRRRSGTEWVNEVKFNSVKSRLTSFIFSTKQAYIIEWGRNYVRFFANGGIVNKNSTSGITFNTSTDKVNWNAHGLVADDPVIFSTSGALPGGLTVGVTYYVIASGLGSNDFKVSTTRGGAAIDLTTAPSGTHSAISPVEVVTPWSETQIWALQFSQSADVLYIGHKDFAPRTLTRTSASAFTLSFYTYLNGPYLGENTTTTTMQPSATSGNVTITASATVGINAGAGFDPTDVGRPITLQYSSKWYWAQITAVDSTTVVHADVFGLVEADGTKVTTFPGTGATGGWKLGAWSAITGWPSAVGFYQQRLVWGRTDTQPQTLWMTKAGVLTSFATTVPAQDDDAITLTILAGEVNAIQWIVEGADLLIGTTGAMRTIGPSDTGKNFSATNLVQKRQSTFGSKDLQPLQIGSVAIYANYYGNVLREFLFSFQQNAYIAPELTILSEHLMRSGVKQFAYAQDIDSIIWCAMGNGELVGITYERDQQIVAMTHHQLGGAYAGSGIVWDSTDPTNDNVPYGIVESVACIPGATRSEVWVIVRRKINGVEKRYVERLTATFEAQQKNTAVFSDSSFSYSGAATNQLTGINWLAGETVSVLADGAVTPPVVVSNVGVLTLPNSKQASKITFGLPYKSRAKTLPGATGTGDGTGLGRRKNVIAANIDYMETGYLEAGSPSARSLEVAEGLRGRSDPMGTSPPLANGILTTRFDRGWRDAGQVVMQTDKPLPATIRSITPVFEAEP